MSVPSPSINPLLPQDCPRVLEINAEGIATGDATFETAVPTWEKWDRGHLQKCRFVARAGDDVLGWAALSPVSDRCAYGGVAEISVYVTAAARGKGIGRRLLGALVTESERSGLWTLQAGIFPENRASVAIHLDAGFREVGRREKLGRLNGAWRDVLMLERRSSVTGRD
jgi:L-amino acid N-acyltransferase YncA